MRKKIASIILLLSFTLFFYKGCTPLDFSKKSPPDADKAPNPANVNIALVLGGGGAKGLAHVGVIEQLEKAGIQPDVIIGSSAGSIIGALYAQDLNIAEVKNKLLHANKKDLIQYSIKGFPFSLFSNQGFKHYLERQLTASQFNQLKIPLITVATELETGKMIPFSKGPLIQAIMASSAYPGAFFPIKIKGRYYIDGGVSNPVPVSVAHQMGAKFIIAVDIGEGLTPEKPRQFMGIMKRSLEISYIHLSAFSAKDADVIIRMSFANVGTFNDSMNEVIYQTGVSETIKKIPEIIKKIQAKMSSTNK